MKATLVQCLERVRSSYWLIPTVMACGAIGASYLTDCIDRGYEDLRDPLGWMQSVRPDGARAILATIAGSMITVAGVSFSITIASVSYATSSFAPRLLDRFLRDRGNQFTLGTFIATFLYCLLVLRTVVGGSGDGAATQFVPHAGVFCALVLATLNVGVMIFFIHHVPMTIHVSNVVARIGQETRDDIRERLPKLLGKRDRDLEADRLPENFDAWAVPIDAASHGYVEQLDYEGLFQLAKKHDLIVRSACSPGSFTLVDRPLAHAYPTERVTDEIAASIRGCYALGSRRTGAQDLHFRINELIEIAIRALSPGVNDPFTAMSCVDWLTTILAELGQQAFGSPHVTDEHGALRLVVRPTDFADFCRAVFDGLEPYAAKDSLTTIHLLGRMGDLVPALPDAPNREQVVKHAHALLERARSSLSERERQEWTERVAELDASSRTEEREDTP